jgi:hypothetical protein
VYDLTPGLDALYIRLTDPDLDVTAGADIASVGVASESGDSETALLTESGGSTGVFEGSLIFNSVDEVAIGDGDLEVERGDSVVASYDDAADELGNPKTTTATAFYAPGGRSGALSGDETWTPAGNPWILVGDLTVPVWHTLTLEAGTHVKVIPLPNAPATGFDIERNELIVQGNLFAHGTADSEVVIEAAGPSPSARDWYGIRNSSSGEDCGIIDLSFTRLSHGRYGVTGTMERLSFQNGSITNVGMGLVQSLGGGTATIRNSTFTTIDSGCIVLQTGYSTPVSWTVENNVCIATASAATGIQLHPGFGAPATIVVDHNTLVNHFTEGVHYGGSTVSGTVTISDLDAPDVDIGVWVESYISPNLDVTISECRFGSATRELGTGIHLEDSVEAGRTPTAVTIVGNTIENFNEFGIFFATARSNAVVRDNDFANILGGSWYAIYNHTYDDVDARFNWWGSVGTAEMDAGGNPKDISIIYDTFDDPARGLVDYSGWYDCRGNCDDGNSCTVDTCTAGSCSYSNYPLDTPCNDGDTGTRNDLCDGAGACAGTPYSCTAGQCEASSVPNGTDCDITYEPAGTVCNDGNQASFGDVCDGAGSCAGTPYTCTPSQCEATSVPNGTDCDVAYLDPGTACDDGRTGTKDDACDGAGSCVGTPYSCTPSQCEATSVPNGTNCDVEYADAGTACDDGVARTEDDRCDDAGRCVGQDLHANVTSGGCDCRASSRSWNVAWLVLALGIWWRARRRIPSPWTAA